MSNISYPNNNLFLTGVQLLYNDVSFCCTMKWIRSVYTSIPSLLAFPPLHPTPLGHHRAPSWLPERYRTFPLAICFTHGSAHISFPISQFIPITPTPRPLLRSLRLCLCPCPAGRLIHAVSCLHWLCRSMVFLLVSPRSTPAVAVSRGHGWKWLGLMGCCHTSKKAGMLDTAGPLSPHGVSP